MLIDKEPLYDLDDRLLGISVHVSYSTPLDYRTDIPHAMIDAGICAARGWDTYRDEQARSSHIRYFAPRRWRLVPAGKITCGTPLTLYLMHALRAAYLEGRRRDSTLLPEQCSIVLRKNAAYQLARAREVQSYNWEQIPHVNILAPDSDGFVMPDRLYGLPIRIAPSGPDDVIDFVGPNILVEIEL
jgi:hypothetical protein